MYRTIDGNKIEYEFDKGRDEVPKHLRGKQCFIYQEGEVLEDIRKIFDRPQAVLKIFFTPADGDMEDYYWGTPWREYSQARTEEIGRISKLVEATAIQNLCWLKDKAPRVYGLVFIKKNGKLYPAQVLENIEGEKAKDDPYVKNNLEELERYLNIFGCKIAHKELVGVRDYIDGKLIDFQGFRFTPKTKQKVKEHVTDRGRYGKRHYQGIEALDIAEKPRNTPNRINWMGFPDIDFTDKKVLDIGCNSGVFCMYAIDRGAKRVVGIDIQRHITVASIIAFTLGYHNIDYIVMDLLKDKLDEEFDITLFLSMYVHVGFPKWIPNQTREVIIFEENAKQSNFKPKGWWEEELGKYFSKVDLIGHSNDQNPDHPKPIFKGVK